MSLNSLLNPTGTDEDQHQNGNSWPVSDPQINVNYAISGPEQWPATAQYGAPFAYPQDIPDATMFDGADLEGTFDFDPSIDGFDSTGASLLLPVSDNGGYSNTSFASTPLSFADDRDPSQDIVMADVQGVEAGTQICYGMLIREVVRLVGKGQDLQEKVLKLRESNQDRAQSFRVRQSTENGKFFLRFPDGKDMGYLSERMTKTLPALINLPQFQLEAFVHPSTIIESIRRAGKASDAKIRVHINVYGLEATADQVGKELSDQGLFLQAPEVCPPGMRYDNPHILKLEDMDETDTEEEEEAEEVEVEQEEEPPEADKNFDETIAEVFSNLRRQNGLSRVGGYENLEHALYPHQEEALDFMAQRETGIIAEEYRLWKPRVINGEQMFFHAITDMQQSDEPDESGGGILADEMGMGKSLTTLVLIAKTKEDARQWAEQRKHLADTVAETPCRATLVVVPSRVLINTWLREVESHMKGSLKIMLYHGRSRKAAIQEIEQYDIVITTYNTLAKEHVPKLFGRGKSPLHEFEWYRVVLDEAHMIRRRETTFHKAAVELRAKSRWCLSGTPIQNSLGDLASLLAFIQVRPFHDPRNFRHWIAYPFEDKELKKRAIHKLTILLEAVCLRRTIERVDLPKPREKTCIVTLSDEERKQYTLTNADMQRYSVQLVGEYSERTTPFGMFQMYLQLRSFCNHGTYQPRFSWAKHHLLDDEADAVRSIARTGWQRCFGCRQPLPVIPRDRRPLYVEGCNHILCDECCKGSSEVHCPLCESVRRPQAEDTVQDNYLLREGYSSKMETLVADVKDDLDTTKSIIFSCWTRTLDLIAKHLRRDDVQIPFRRIDGKTPPAERQRLLDEFDSTGRVPVLIMTTGTGAFGLNLQSVNRVFIVEPQWNPSVESQAVARAIRLGQKQQVSVTRYHVENSIEEDMCLQQFHKLEISRMNFSKDAAAVQTGELVTTQLQALPDHATNA
ncbi:SNF2 family N-terminal domain-containing protein [Aspergillus karnatakaensis]|uniref:SNF2 family N-terminal domain-containing protein n=1 Tax=Aspergillus karnatakaensis TaxID=1810916 RepID=UPI003CCDAED0